jgi:hypothetical protein
VRLISTSDDELYGLASIAGKLGRADKLLARLECACSADPLNGDDALRYALAQMAVLPSVEIELGAHARVTATVEALGEVLAIDPENWLARYSRARLRAQIPSSYGAYAVQFSDLLALAAADLEYLIARQADRAPEPYFVSAHALAAVIEQLAENPASAARRPSLRVALAACPRAPARLPALGSILCEPLVTLYLGADGEFRDEIGAVLFAVYSGQAAVDALRREPAGR